MNYSALPDLLVILGLVVIFVLLSRRGDQRRLRWWAFGWALVLCQSVAVLVADNVATTAISNAVWAVALSVLLLSSIAFVWAADVVPQVRRHAFIIALLGTTADIALIVCFVYGLGSLMLYALLTTAGAIESILVYHRSRRTHERITQNLKIGYLSAAYAMQLAFVLAGKFEIALAWLLCWHFLACAATFRLESEEANVGVTITALSFIAWGSVFPIRLAIGVWFPHLGVPSEIWSLPEYLVAIGMLVTLLEEQTVRLRRAALYDALTDIPNRRRLLQDLEGACEKARTRQYPFALMSMDLDLFKEVNDRVGHSSGDQVLRQVAERLRRTMRQYDTLARTGGDEFAVLLPGVNSQAIAEAVVKKLGSLFDRPFRAGDKEYLIGASIGYALAPSECAESEALCRLADRRMHQAKENGRRQPRAHVLNGATGSASAYPQEPARR